VSSERPRRPLAGTGGAGGAGTTDSSDSDSDSFLISSCHTNEQRTPITLSQQPSSKVTLATQATQATQQGRAIAPGMKPLMREDQSPVRDALKAKIQLVVKIMFDLETRGAKLDTKPPPPGDPSKMDDDDIYILWCAAPNTKWYKQELFKLVEELQAKEEKERKRLRDAKYIAYDNDLSPHRKYLRAKMDTVKQVAFEFYPLKAEGKASSILPRDPELMDVDVFLVWCLRLPDYQECRRADRYLGCKYTTTTSYDQELGCLLECLQLRDDEEHQLLRKKKEAASYRVATESGSL